MVVVLSSDQRRVLEQAVGAGRVVAESAVEGVLGRLGVVEGVAPEFLSESERGLRVALRARARALGDVQVGDGFPGGVPLLAAEVAYVQWHRLLFARFLEANGLLIHPEHEAAVSLAECDELAEVLGEPDGWGVASRFAAQILPGIFRPDDPAAQVRLATEDRLALEEVVVGLPDAVLVATDALGWVYQYWQSKAKKLVNESGRKIGGSDLAPVTQLFTEDYMVRFLLENSLGAWWAGKHPESPLLGGYEFLRFDEETGLPAAGTFEGWPATVAEVTMMDPCCGSGHFLVAGFHMLSAMRAEEEGLSLTAAQDAVLAENLFGLELDPRCTQIAMFALALEAWKTTGYRVLPVPNVACSGIPAKAPLAEWTALADGDYQLEQALTRLHTLFKDADTLGSLIDPVRAAEQDSLDSVDWHKIAPILQTALTKEAARTGDPAAEVFGHAAAGIARAADLLAGKYTLVATNPPYLTSGRHSLTLVEFLELHFRDARGELATALVERFMAMGRPATVIAVVSPQNWNFLRSFEVFRRKIFARAHVNISARLGERAFQSSAAAGAFVALTTLSLGRAPAAYVRFIDCSSGTHNEKPHLLRQSPIVTCLQNQVAGLPGALLVPFADEPNAYLGGFADIRAGVVTGDTPVFARYFWEIDLDDRRWTPIQSAASDRGGRSQVILWENEVGRLAAFAESVRHLNHAAQKWRRGKPLWAKRGVAVNMLRNLSTDQYFGDIFDGTVAVMVPFEPKNLPALAAFAASSDFAPSVRRLNSKNSIESGTLLKVPFDVDRWRAVAAAEFPDGLPEPYSEDPTQWLFKGAVSPSSEPLQVAVGRLLGFSWPDQVPDVLDQFVDGDGIVCVPPVAGELPASERVRQVLAAGFGDEWSASKLDELLVAAGAKAGAGLEVWLRDGFAKHHNKVFSNRPFIWQVWDGRKDGFSALVNYHRLDRATLEKLTYTTLGWWIDQQRADAESGVTGAEARLVAATGLQDRLKLIIAGEPPYDIFVRWKTLAEQPLGWEPDLDDGVRLNIRPFVEAKVLRAAPNVNWKKDRGTNPDGTERYNDLHHTRAEKLAARGQQ